jgi:hypothetical protein
MTTGGCDITLPLTRFLVVDGPVVGLTIGPQHAHLTHAASQNQYGARLRLEAQEPFYEISV